MVSPSKSIVGSSDEVTLGSGVTISAGEAILDTSQLDHSLGCRGGDDLGSAGGRDEPDTARTATTGDLHGDGVGLTELVTPVASTDGNQ